MLGLPVLYIDDENLLDAIELIRKNPSCSLMLSCRKNIKEPDTIQELFGSCFPSAFNSEETCVNYLSLALGVCGYGDIVLRVSGFEDERVAAIDLIYKCAEAGADAAKFQHFDAKTIVSDLTFNNFSKQISHQKNWKNNF